MTFDEFLSHLEGVKGGGNQRYARCPAHEDKHQSLSVSVAGDGKILLNCHAGCTAKDITEAMGLSIKDLFVDKAVPTSKTIVATYKYIDQNGKTSEKLRYSNKSFQWRHKGKNGGWEYNRKGISPSLYMTGWGQLQSPVYLVEGEKDADALISVQRSAVSPPDGAGSKWYPQYTESLRGLDVVIIQDNDEAGIGFAQKAASELIEAARSVKVLDLTKIWPELPKHGDASDLLNHMGKQGAVKAIERLAGDTPDFQAISLQDGKIDNDYRGKRLTIELTSIVLQELHIEVRYNIILKRMEVSGLPDEYSKENAPNTLPFFLIDYFKQKGITGVSSANVSGYLSCIADKNRYNPVEEFIAQGEWDGVDRVKETCDMIGISEPQHCTYVKKWLIQCVAMALNGDEAPVGADGVLVLQGEQGIAKTSFFRKISSCPQWFVEGAVIDMKNKDSLINATSGWICELGELDSTISREQSALKAFITSPWDNIRMPYAKEATRSPRHTSFCGTVNPEKYLRDETGSRRFWTIPVTQIDTEKLFSLKTEWIHQLWLQAYALYEQDHNGFRLSREEMKSVQAENQKFNIPLRYETEIREMLEYELPIESWEWYTSSEIANRLPGNPDSKVVGKALKKVVQELETVFHPVPPLPPKLSKPLHGTAQYFIPLKRFQVYRVEQVEEGCNRIS